MCVCVCVRVCVCVCVLRQGIDVEVECCCVATNALDDDLSHQTAFQIVGRHLVALHFIAKVTEASRSQIRIANRLQSESSSTTRVCRHVSQTVHRRARLHCRHTCCTYSTLVRIPSSKALTFLSSAMAVLIWRSRRAAISGVLYCSLSVSNDTVPCA
jgi:hypothetical protein